MSPILRDPAVKSAALSAATTTALGMLSRRSPGIAKVATAGLAIWAIVSGINALKSALKEDHGT
jgi:hypothetical protein